MVFRQIRCATTSALDSSRRSIGTTAEFIKCMRSAGLPVEILIDYVALVQEGDKTIEARKEILVEQRKLLVERMNEMQKTLSILNSANHEFDSNPFLTRHTCTCVLVHTCPGGRCQGVLRAFFAKQSNVFESFYGREMRLLRRERHPPRNTAPAVGAGVTVESVIYSNYKIEVYENAVLKKEKEIVQAEEVMAGD